MTYWVVKRPDGRARVSQKFSPVAIFASRQAAEEWKADAPHRARDRIVEAEIEIKELETKPE